MTEFTKGTWQYDLKQSGALLDRSAAAKKKAGTLLWKGAVAAIESWLPTSGDDANGEGLYNEVLDALGASRKGDASKIKTVALAVKSKGLDISEAPNLSRAYAEAVALTKTAKEQEAEDDAAEEAIASIEAPRTATSEEGAAKILLAKGVDGAVVAILDALGADNEAAHRAFVRAMSSEVADRIRAKADAEKAKVKAERDAAAAAKKAERDKAAAEKAEAAKEKAKAAKKAAPKPSAKKAKPAPAPEEDEADLADDEGVTEIDDLDEETPAPEAPVAKKAARRVPVRRK